MTIFTASPSQSHSRSHTLQPDDSPIAFPLSSTSSAATAHIVKKDYGDSFVPSCDAGDMRTRDHPPQPSSTTPTPRPLNLNTPHSPRPSRSRPTLPRRSTIAPVWRAWARVHGTSGSPIRAPSFSPPAHPSPRPNHLSPSLTVNSLPFHHALLAPARSCAFPTVYACKSAPLPPLTLSSSTTTAAAYFNLPTPPQPVNKAQPPSPAVSSLAKRSLEVNRLGDCDEPAVVRFSVRAYWSKRNTPRSPALLSYPHGHSGINFIPPPI